MQYEINQINFELITKLLAKTKLSNKAPNVFIDKSFASEEVIEFACLGGGHLDGYLIYTTPEESIARSEKRGLETARYEDTHGILSAHSAIATKLVKTMLNHKDKDITSHLFSNSNKHSNASSVIAPCSLSYANNQNYKIAPQEIATISFNEQNIVTQNPVEFCAFLNKTQLEVEASLASQNLVYSGQNYCENYIMQLMEAGYDFF